ncbi:UDP-N-acetylmuramoyl-L-alanyl-D-glutamate--2,6-diaminopimelate ligase [Rhodobacteraceae bacterium NNCM2]|nr:UDP-N-acetylmuramoyl-L-alanyl-D-glutamate--2,6-diaminopimelate ligase [Coraliihabitans acroporae]
MALDHQGAAPDGATPVRALAVDSREVKEGDVFVAIPGLKLDGAEFAQYAVRQGAAAVVITPEGLEIARRDIGDLTIPFFITPEPRAELARLAAAFYAKQPAVMAAITGTNGKTSTAHFLRQIWQAAGHPAAAFGTTGVEGEGFEEPLSHTTPEPITLHALLARLAEKGCTHAAMEASSHGLVQHRLDGVRLKAAGLSNITRDHMDYHPTHEDYVAAKLRLFGAVLPPGGVAVLNADDPVFDAARALADGRGQPVISVGRGPADLQILDSRFDNEGQEVDFSWDGLRHTARLGLVGSFQADNVMLAAGLAIATGVPAETVFAALPGLTGVKGRMEHVATRANGAAIYVDYSHTPDALQTAIKALRPHCAGRLIVVFGAGGDRDPGKRPLMGRAVAIWADQAIITDDNPRSEDPAAIRAAIRQACPQGDEVGDRAEAILTGVDALKSPDDCLLIAGKGHEQGQVVGGEILPFDDGEQARAAVVALDGLEADL